MFVICILLKSDIVFELNILSIPTYSDCMTLGLCWFYQQVDTCQPIMMELLDLGCSFLLGSYYHLDLSMWGDSSSIEAQGEVELPRAASHYYQAFFPAQFWVKVPRIIVFLLKTPLLVSETQKRAFFRTPHWVLSECMRLPLNPWCPF